MSKFINIQRVDIKLGKERHCHITKQLVPFFGEHQDRSTLESDVLALTILDVYLKRMHQLYNVKMIPRPHACLHTIYKTHAKLMKNNNLMIMSKPHAFFQAMNKTSSKFQKDQAKDARGVDLTKYSLNAF